MQKPNVLLVPKWKDRTHKTHLQHLASQTQKEYRMAFLGDSMMERWLTTGAEIWAEHYAKDCINLGVGGDGIEHLLYRLKGTKDIPGLPGCLDNISVEIVQLMIGTNNLANRSVDHILAGTVNVINLVKEKQPKASIRLYGLPYRKDIDKSKVTELNAKLAAGFPHLYVFFGDSLDLDKDYDDHVHLNQSGYAKWLMYLQ